MKLPDIICTLWLVFAACGSGVHSDASTDARADPSASPLVCDLPDGASHLYTLQSELKQLVTGKWVLCSGSTLLSQSEIGIEFVAGGTYYSMINDGTGKVVRGSGFGSSGTWEFPDSSSLQIEWTLGPSSWRQGDVQFEDNPRRFLMEQLPDGEKSYY